MYRFFINSLKSGDVGNIYLLHGSETYLLDKAVEEMTAYLIKDFPEINLTIFEEDNFDLSALINACSTMPFGGDKRLIIVKDFAGLVSKSKKTSEEGAEGSKESDKAGGFGFISELPDTACLVFVNYAEADRRKKLYKDINKIGKIYEFGKISKSDLVQWIKGHFTRAGKEIKPMDLEYFAANTGYLDKNSDMNLYHVQNEINKALAYIGQDKAVTKEHLEKLFPKSLENDIFKLIDACWEKNISKSLKIYNDMLLCGESSFSILAMISKGIKNLIRIKELRSRGLDAKSISEKTKIHEYTVKLYVKHTDKMNYTGLEKALERCLTCEKDIKTGKSGERLSFEMLFASLFDE
ncbi:DNA polymerase III subunit delta [Lutispora saccharofermentans]|uniref:DNA polymerase III subunit delta n=1 Tax=Lutispora saccharofermentans TaxID=3024236 RepID=A0ABT1NI13_9FIRM|nr:DNA polymerase III subunit delta [Lutispora saccharofermentans]MCQ1530879.1 DNA polymerase III subunit delta [Lutispora saccharofermentans]